MAFGLEITFITLAAGSAYAVLMFVLKKEVQKKPVKVASLLTVAFSLLTLSVTQMGFGSVEDSLATTLLLITVLGGGSLVMKIKKADDVLSSELASLSKNIGVLMFTSLVVHWLSVIYFLAF